MSVPDRPLPSRISLEQQRKQAKELLRAFRAGDDDAVRRVRRHLPDKPGPTLADAQFVLARELGFQSWSALKTRVEEAAQPLSPSAEEALRRAFHGGDAAAADALLRRHPAARARLDDRVFPFDGTALGHFAGRGELAMVEVLLAHGADPNRRSGWWAGGFHPLHSATGAVADRLMEAGAVPDACAAAHLDRPDLLRQILDADPARVHERGGDGQTPLHFARSVEVADLLLSRGADVDARDVDHRATPAQWMLDHTRGAGRYDLARFLVVERGAAADVFLAAALGLDDRLRTMLRADPSLVRLRTGQGEYGPKPPSSHHIYFWTLGANLSPLQVAAQFGQPAAMDALREFASPRERFVAACAAARGDEAREILRENPGVVREMGPAEHRALADAAWAADPAAVALMMEMGFDPAAPGHDGGSALHCACWEGSAAAVAAILQYDRGRALIAVRDPRYGATPLGWCTHGAANRGPGRGADHAAVARLLLEAGARPEPGWEETPHAVREAIRPYAR